MFKFPEGNFRAIPFRVGGSSLTLGVGPRSWLPVVVHLGNRVIPTGTSHLALPLSLSRREPTHFGSRTKRDRERESSKTQ